MAQLIFRGAGQVPDEVETAFDGTPSECLAAAIDYFVKAYLERCERIVKDGADIAKLEYIGEHVLTVAEHVLTVAKRTLDDHKNNRFQMKCTVVANDDGSYFLYPFAEGGDRYDLVN